MSHSIEGSSCVVCHAYLFPEDDIVYCPVCGAPHHRDCYNAVGHCRLEELHGTDRQYDKIAKEQIKETPDADNGVVSSASPEHDNTDGQTQCSMCHALYNGALNSCPKCGSPNIGKMGGNFTGFDFLGGVPADYDIGDGITADEAKRLVATNTPRYIPKFAVLNKKKRVSWNWAAFLFPCGWMLSRKMYKNGIIAGLLTIISMLLILPFESEISRFGTTGNQTYADIFQTVYNNIPEIGKAILAVAAAGLISNLLIRLISAIFGDYFYKNHTITMIKAIRANSSDIDYDYRKKGGVSFILFIVGFMAVEYIPIFIFMLL